MGLSGEAEFLQAVARARHPGAEVVVFVHGYNNTLGSAVFRHAQMAHDFGLEGPQVTFAWASASDPLGYVHDRDSIGIARDDLEALLVALARRERRIRLVGHSMGAQLVTETLRQMSIGGEHQALARLSGVVLISPDIDVDVFRSQVERINPLPQPFVASSPSATGCWASRPVWCDSPSGWAQPRTWCSFSRSESRSWT